MEDLQLQEIYIYPIKSLGGISLQQAQVQETGLQYDRRWMLVDTNGSFISQRTFSQLALMQVSMSEDGLVVTHKKQSISPLSIPFHASTGKQLQVTIWDDKCNAVEVSTMANEWFSHVLQMHVQLVYMPSSTKRLVDQDYASNNEIVSFADAYPFMMISQASLDDLNSRLSEPLPINRFRPNFVISGGSPYCEDLLASFRIADITFYGVKLCSRCVLTTIDQQNATKGKEPLKTLSSYRLRNHKVMFGQNLLGQGYGSLKVGDKLHVQQLKNIEIFA